MNQQQLASLMNTSAYPERTNAVSCIQTHVSWIFLTDSHAYKIKKPVNFGFLDFSTTDRRHFFCDEEVRLNRRLSPEMYEAVVAVRETPDGAAFHGSGRIIDYAVRMKRLPEDRILSRMIAEGCAGADEIRQVAEAVARFHIAAPTSPAVADYGRTEQIQFNWQENFDQTAPFIGETISRSAFDRIRGWVDSFLDRNRQLFEDRVVQGFVRECDGDLHLDNICLDEGRIQIFDCIEFNERFRCCDTAADMAFLLMDLDYHGRTDLADAAQKTYCALTGDTGATKLFTFYRMYRAFVRGKVESFQIADSGISIEQRSSARARAERYFRLARGYAERERLQRCLIITCGLMGSGKSTFAARLGFESGIPVVSSDKTRKRLSGHAPTDTLHEQFGDGIYTPACTERVYAELMKQAQLQLERGASAIIDASFIRRTFRKQAAEVADRLQARLITVVMECDRVKLVERLNRRLTQADSISDGRPELLDQQAGCFEVPDDSEGMILRISAEESTDQFYERLTAC